MIEIAPMSLWMVLPLRFWQRVWRVEAFSFQGQQAAEARDADPSTNAEDFKIYWAEQGLFH